MNDAAHPAPQAKPEKPVSALEIAAFAAPAAPLLALTLPSVIFLPPHFVTHLGLQQWVVAAIFFGARVFDIVLDPFLGSLQDRTKSAFGRRRIWLGGSTPFLMALIWFVFIGLGPGAPAILATLGVLALYVVFDAAMVAHLGWSGEIVPTYHGRTHVLGAVQTASLIGEVLLLALAAYVVQGLGGSNADAVSTMGWSLIVMLPLTVALAVFGARDRPTPPQPHLTIKFALQTVWENQVARRVLLPDLLLGVAQGVSGGLFLFYFQFVLGFLRESQTLVAIYFVAGLIGVPVWWWAARRFGKDKALFAAFIYSSVTTTLLLVLPHGAFGPVAAFMIVAGLAQGGTILLTRSLMADVVDEDELKTGSRRSGIYFGLLLMTSKTGLAAGPLAYALLQVLGFEAVLGANNSPQALGALSAIFIGVPVVLCALGALSMRNYPLDETRQAALAAAIAERHSKNSENTLGPSTK